MKYIILTLSSIVTTVMSGFTVMKLWAWFIVPTFGIFAITVPQAIGIWLLGVSWFLCWFQPMISKQGMIINCWLFEFLCKDLECLWFFWPDSLLKPSFYDIVRIMITLFTIFVLVVLPCLIGLILTHFNNIHSERCETIPMFLSCMPIFNIVFLVIIFREIWFLYFTNSNRWSTTRKHV